MGSSSVIPAEVDRADRSLRLDGRGRDTHAQVDQLYLVKMRTCHCLDFDALHQAMGQVLLPRREHPATARGLRQVQEHDLSQYRPE